MPKRKVEDFEKVIKKQKLLINEDPQLELEKIIKKEIDSIISFINSSGYVVIKTLPELLQKFKRNKFEFSEDIILYSLKGIEESDRPDKYVNIVRCLLHHDVSFSFEIYRDIYSSYKYYKEFRSVFGHRNNTFGLSNCFKKVLEMMDIIRENNIDLSFVKLNINLQKMIKEYNKTPIYNEDKYFWSWGVRCYKMDDYSGING